MNLATFEEPIVDYVTDKSELAILKESRSIPNISNDYVPILHEQEKFKS